MPSSANDRFTVDFEYLFFFSKERKYYFEKQLEPYTEPMNRWGGNKLKATGSSSWDSDTGQSTYRDRNLRPDPKGRNMRCVWKISTKALQEAHFAVYPEELCKIPIQAGCPKNGIVLDPFMGSGTTAAAAKKLSRNFIGFDINPEYCNKISSARLHKITERLDKFL
jgi:DNA modification methylase